MEIQSVIPDKSGLSTTIWAIVPSEQVKMIAYSYSYAYEMLRNPNNRLEWLTGQKLSLTEAIQFVISL